MKFAPILLALLYGFAMYHFSAWRTARQLDAQSTVLADRRLRAMTARMATALDLKSIPVHVYEIDPVNGLAAPDGRIFITRGFLTKYQSGLVSAEEMASVIAHELGHVALGHARRRMIDFSGQNALRTALMARIDDVTVVKDFGTSLEAPKTREIVDALGRLGIEADSKVLIVLGTPSEVLRRSVRNLEKVKLIAANQLNVFDLLHANALVLGEEALATIQEVYGDD